MGVGLQGWSQPPSHEQNWRFTHFEQIPAKSSGPFLQTKNFMHRIKSREKYMAGYVQLD